MNMELNHPAMGEAPNFANIHIYHPVPPSEETSMYIYIYIHTYIYISYMIPMVGFCPRWKTPWFLATWRFIPRRCHWNWGYHPDVPPRSPKYMIETNNSEKKTKPSLTGWWFEPLWKNMKVNWDDYSQYMGKYKMFQTTNQLSTVAYWAETTTPKRNEKYIEIQDDFLSPCRALDHPSTVLHIWIHLETPDTRHTRRMWGLLAVGKSSSSLSWWVNDH